LSSILIVDDESLVRRMTRIALERAGHRVAEAADGADYTIGKPFNIPELVALVARALAA